MSLVGGVMEGVWGSAIKYCGVSALAALVGYTVYPQIIASPYLKNLTHVELFILLALIVIVVFILCLVLVNAGIQRAAGSNIVNVKNSSVRGDVRAGNNTTNEKK
jgi:hypothetical protein